MKKKIYTAWTRPVGQKTETLTECVCDSVKAFKTIITKSNAIVTSRVRIKRN